MTKIDQRKTASAETNLKKADAGRKGKGSTAFTAKVVKSREVKLQERIELVVRMALEKDGSHLHSPHPAEKKELSDCDE